MAKDYYKTLGVEKKATKDDIKKAFRKLAHQYHPDKKGGDEQKFKEASEAYQILSDDRKRAEYDSYGQAFSGNGGAGGFGGAQGFGGFDFSGFQNGGFEGMEFDLGDIFGDVFGGRGSGTQARRGRDISVDLQIPFEEAVFGTERKILITKVSQCEKCKGSGAEEGSKMKTCAQCNGKGKFHETRKSFLGTFTTVRECDMCGGAGKVPDEKCGSCAGLGVARGESEIAIKIPAGIQNGEVIRMSGRGEATARGITGDLYIKIHVLSHKIFKRDGADLRMDLDIKLSDALLGAEYSIQTLDGAIKLKVPEGVSINETLRVKGKGVPSDPRTRGDLLVRLNIKMPQKLSKKAREAIEKLKEEGV